LRQAYDYWQDQPDNSQCTVKYISNSALEPRRILVLSQEDVIRIM